MFPGIDPKMMKMAMKKMGIKQEEIEAKEVVIKLADKEIVVKNPSVQKVNMMGQETFQISGEIEERGLEANYEKFNSDDVKTVAEQAGCSEAEAKKALDETGDIAEAILKLKQ